MACNTTTGVCLPYSCNWGYYKNASNVCTSKTVDASTALLTDTTGLVANCIGFNRGGGGGSDTCLTLASVPPTKCSDAGYVDAADGTSYCFACAAGTNMLSTPGTTSNMLMQNGSDGIAWIKESVCGTGSSSRSQLDTCSEWAGANYCVLCKDGYISQRSSSSAAVCISRSTNTKYLDPAQLLYCLMVDASGNCLYCDVFKNSTMTSNAACTAPTDPGIVGRFTYPETAGNKYYYRQTSHTGSASFPDVFIGEKVTSAPTSAHDTTKGGNIFVKTTADSNSMESYSLASDYPYIYGAVTQGGVHYIYTFGYGYYVEESYIAYRTPSHTFGTYKTWANSGSWECPKNPTDNVECSGKQVSGSTKCQSVNSASPVQPNCECQTGYAGLACEETVTKTYTSNFSYSEKATAVGTKFIFATTRENMINYGFTDIRAQVPDYTQKSGGQDIMAMTRGQFINGKYDKQTWNGNVWTANSYLPGFQKKYWSGTKLGDEVRRLRVLEGLGNGTRKARLRILSRFFNAESYKMTVGLNKNAFSGMAANTNIYFTMVRLFNREIKLSAETLERGMPLALKIVIPILSVGAILVLILVMWCMFAEGDDEEQEGEGGADESKVEPSEDNQNLIKNSSNDSDKKSNKTDNQVFPIGEAKQKTMEKTMNDDADVGDQDRNPATQTMPLSNEPFIEKEQKPSNNFIEEHVSDQMSVPKKPDSMVDDKMELGLQGGDDNGNFEDL